MDNRSDVYAESEGVIEYAGNEVYENVENVNLRENVILGDFTFQRITNIPIVKGNDVITQTQPGSGQTLSFSIGILQQIDTTIRECQVLILAPTREWAIQIQRVVMSHGEGMKINSYTCIGGTNVRDDSRNLEAGCHLVIGTPGRVIDMIRRKKLRTEHVKVFVLEESENLFHPDFKDQIQNLVSILPNDVKIIRGPSKKSIDTQKSSGAEDLAKNCWLLDNQKRVCITEVGVKNKKCFIDIREYNEKNGKMYPFKKKGLSLTIEEWEKLLEVAEEINKEIAKYHNYRREMREGSAAMETEGVVESSSSNTSYTDVNLREKLFLDIQPEDVIKWMTSPKVCDNWREPRSSGNGKPSYVQQRANISSVKGDDIIAQTKSGTNNFEHIDNRSDDGLDHEEPTGMEPKSVHESTWDELHNTPYTEVNLREKLLVDNEKPTAMQQRGSIICVKSHEVISQTQKSGGDDGSSKNSWLLGKQRRVCLTEFEDCKRIDIRDYHMKDGLIFPRKKSISLTISQWKKLLEVAEEINKEIGKY